MTDRQFILYQGTEAERQSIRDAFVKLRSLKAVMVNVPFLCSSDRPRVERIIAEVSKEIGEPKQAAQKKKNKRRRSKSAVANDVKPAVAVERKKIAVAKKRVTREEVKEDKPADDRKKLAVVKRKPRGAITPKEAKDVESAVAADREKIAVVSRKQRAAITSEEPKEVKAAASRNKLAVGRKGEKENIAPERKATRAAKKKKSA